jgi:hypothetical protein
MGYSIDGPTKIISLTLGTTSFSVRDIWSRWTDWYLTSDNSKYLPAFVNVGGDDIDLSEGTSIPIYAFLLNGWRIKPQEANHTLKVNDGIIVVDGGGDPFVNTTGSFIVRINYQQPVQAITVSTSGGSGGATPEEIWTYSTRTLTDAMDTLLDVARSLNQNEVPESFAFTYAVPLPTEVFSPAVVFSNPLTCPFAETFVGYYNIETKTWRDGDPGSLPLDMKAEVLLQQTAYDDYLSELSAWNITYNDARWAEYRKYLAQTLIDVCTP